MPGSVPGAGRTQVNGWVPPVWRGCTCTDHCSIVWEGLPQGGGVLGNLTPRVHCLKWPQPKELLKAENIYLLHLHRYIYLLQVRRQGASSQSTVCPWG